MPETEDGERSTDLETERRSAGSNSERLSAGSVTLRLTMEPAEVDFFDAIASLIASVFDLSKVQLVLMVR